MPQLGKFFVTTSPGLKQLLLEELQGMGLKVERNQSFALGLAGNESDWARVVLNSRVASKILEVVAHFYAESLEELYELFLDHPWHELFPVSKSFAVKCSGEQSLASPMILPLKIKDGICDSFRRNCQNKRPNVDTKNPDLQLEVHFNGPSIDVSVDWLGGEPLHRRGYRVDGSAAPMREQRAAALLRYAGWKEEESLHDPMCGSGSLCLEAALQCLPMSPNQGHNRLQKHSSLPERLRRALAQQKEQALQPRKASKLLASDIDSRALQTASKNMARLPGASNLVELRCDDFRRMDFNSSLILCNPPYGKRLGDAVESQNLVMDLLKKCEKEKNVSRLGFYSPSYPFFKSFPLIKRQQVPAAKLPLQFSLFVFDR